MSKMLTINFLPDSDFWKLEGATEKYRWLWGEEGKKIVKVVERVSGLRFRETFINAVVFKAKFPSQSFPLSLRADIDDDRKLPTLIHELCHRLIVANRVRLLKLECGTEEERILERHRVVDLVLYDIWVDLYGRKFADKAVLAESNSPKTDIYKRAWRWVLAMNREKKQKLFNTCKGVE